MKELVATFATKKTTLNIIAALFIINVADFANAVDINGFTLSGDERAGWVSYDYGNPGGDPTINKGHKDSEGFYVIPKLSLQTPDYNGFNAKITVAGATDFGINEEGKQSRNFVFDPTDEESFVILQEFYLEYDEEAHNAMIGRNEIVTPMIDFDDWYMLGNSFEIVKYTNTYLNNHRLHIGYFNKMSGVWDSGENGTEFHTMSDASFVPQINKDQADGKGVYYLAAEYNGEKHQGQVWEYYAQDLYNMLFGQYNFKNGNNKYNDDFGLQFINWSQVGKLKTSATEINYSLYSIKYDGNMDNGFSFATGISKYSDGPGTGSTLGAWGGYPYFANGMIFHFFEAGDLRNASSYKVQGGYDLSKAGVDNTVIKLRYTFFDLDPTRSISSVGTPQDSMEMIGLQISYNFLNTGYFNATFERHNIEKENPTDAIRLIGGYKF
ncbi:MAG: hypothetical protein KAJ32_03230 [Gammaproteobacteria bacterium]|nr:hypothetical protein [Gammaproteobacteria bacterium]